MYTKHGWGRIVSDASRGSSDRSTPPATFSSIQLSLRVNEALPESGFHLRSVAKVPSRSSRRELVSSRVGVLFPWSLPSLESTSFASEVSAQWMEIDAFGPRP
ncbi:hypothetical protein VNO77_18839 [Canavalia gladiata]|uniref:Uncharacterized protein n=1 Tax=Canavalia gladiata TaxID=3824 RepID=A0AAN9LLN7_CANGL